MEQGMPYAYPGDPAIHAEKYLLREDAFLVDWDGPDDKGNPQNWAFRKKVGLTALLSFICLVCTWASAIFSTGQAAAGREFGVGEEVMQLGTSLFLCGYAVGPAIFAPMSEQFGRKLPLFVGYFMLAIFTIAGATAKDVQTVLITRFFGGLFGSTPLVLVGSIFADFWSSEVRGIAVCIFAIATFVGPAVAPIVGTFIVESYLGWRWTLYLTAIMAFFMFILGVIFYQETYPSAILSKRAANKRYTTGNFAWHHKSEEKPFKISDVLTVYIKRPIEMLWREPIVLFLTIYVSFVYAILYLLLSAIPIAFIERGWRPTIATLPFLSIIIGVFVAAAIIIGFNPYYMREMKRNNGRPVPRARLPPMIIGGFVFPIGFFIFAWTADYDHAKVFWLVPCIGLSLIGCGILLIFLQALNYLIDVYLMYSASAIAANTMVRSLLAAAFPLVAGYFFRNLGTNIAATILGALALAMAPVPIAFYKFDKYLRNSSKYSVTPGEKMPKH